MKKIIPKLLVNPPNLSSIILSGALIMGLFPMPFVTNHASALSVSELKKLDSIPARDVVEPLSLAGLFFGADAKLQSIKTLIKRQMEFVRTRRAYSASLSVIKKHETTIKTLAREKGVPEDVAIGVALLENGGSETAVSKAGALGVFQLMPGTARALGLTVSKKMDERRNPNKNIEAGISYLKANYNRFGDWGLATWAYHAGEGNVAKALKLYANENHHIKLAGLKDQEEMRRYVAKYGITIHKLLSSASVKTMTRKLSDDSAGYPYKVMATATLFRETTVRVQAFALPGLIVENR